MTRLRRCAWTLIITILAISVPAAQTDSTRLLDSADELMRTLDFAKARPIYEGVLEAARQANREPEIARALLGLAQIARSERKTAQARTGLVEALAISERLGDRMREAEAHNLLAVIERLARNREAALGHAERALAISESLGNDRGIAAAVFQLAELEESDVEAAGRYYARAAASARLADDLDLEGRSLHDHADRLFAVGQYERALELLTGAARVYEKMKSPYDVGTVYNSIGRVYRAHGRLDEALKYQQAALALHRTAGDPFALLQSLNAVAVVHQRRNELPEARKYLEEAIGVAAAIPPTPAAARAVDFLRANMAGVLISLGQLEPAIAALELVLAGGRDDFPSTRHMQLSMAYSGLGRYAEALAAAERAVALCGNSPISCIEAHMARSDARAGLGDREAALADLSMTLRRIEEMRSSLVPSDFFKQGFTSTHEKAYNSAIARQLDAGRDREALETAELSRSRAFLDLLASRSIAPATKTAPALPLTLRGGDIAGSVASPVTTAPANADELIRTAARLQSTLVLYWVTTGETVIWVINPDGRIDTRRVKVTRARLAALVRDTAPFKDAAATKGAAAPMALRESPAAWRELYTLLIAPVKAMLPKRAGALLTIVPHDTLSNLSFAALQDGRGRYLLEDYTLHYAPAGALFQFTSAQRRPQSRAGAMLLVADPDLARRSTLDPELPRLPGARTEARAIASQWRAGQALSLSGVTATESAVRQQSPSRSILHFAAHAVIRDDDPFASYLALAKSSSGGEDGDGALTAQEVYRLNLDADLVVLSACRSASGTIAGDGVATFARAFLYAGAASLVASVWELADEPSNRLLPDFYRAWLGGATKAAALRDAQLRLLKDLRAGRVRVTTAIGPVAVPEHPVFWAGVALFGEPD